MLYRLLLVMMLLIVCTTPAGAETVQVDAAMDAAFFDTEPDNNIGRHTHVPAGVTNTGRVNHAVFFMDIASFIPAGATINSASFVFDVTRQGGGVDADFALHRVITAWDEGTGIGNGGAVTGNGVTWNNATATTAWSTPGGDYAAADSGQVFVTGVSTFSLGNAQLVADLQAMLDGTTSNFGFLLRAVLDNVTGTAVRVGSQETGGGARFVIDFTPMSVSGDLDGDGFIGVTDLDLVLASWGTSHAAADADGSGTVGQGDLDIVLGQWGDGAPPDVNVPEPGSLALLGLGGLILAQRRR